MNRILMSIFTAISISFVGLTWNLAHAESIESKINQLGTAKYLFFTGLDARVKNNLLTVNLEVENKDNDDQEAFYRVQWLDQDGDPVWDEEAWKPVKFHGNQKIRLHMIAPTIKASDFKIEFSAESNWRK